MFKEGTRVKIINAEMAREYAAAVENGEIGKTTSNHIGDFSVGVIRDNNARDRDFGGYLIPCDALEEIRKL